MPMAFTEQGVAMLSSRPDVRSAERTLEAAFYGTNAARSAFYPSITLSGSAGWTNSTQKRPSQM